MASDPDTWSQLRHSVANWLNRDDLGAEITEFIALAERHFDRALASPERETIEILTATAETVTLPPDFRALRAIHLESSPIVVPEELDLSDLRRLYAGAASGMPRHYTLQGTSLLLAPAPAPSAPCTLALTYQRAIPPLGEERPSNWLLAAHPDLYLAGALLEGFLFLRDAEAAGAAMARRDMLIDSINAASRRKRHNGPLARRGPISTLWNIRA